MIARLLEGGQQLAENPLLFSGEVSIFNGRFDGQNAGFYLLEVLAIQTETQNFGRATMSLEVE